MQTSIILLHPTNTNIRTIIEMPNDIKTTLREIDKAAPANTNTFTFNRLKEILYMEIESYTFVKGNCIDLTSKEKMSFYKKALQNLSEKGRAREVSNDELNSLINCKDNMDIYHKAEE